jgi:hypothetical protein
MMHKMVPDTFIFDLLAVLRQPGAYRFQLASRAARPRKALAIESCLSPPSLTISPLFC